MCFRLTLENNLCVLSSREVSKVQVYLNASKVIYCVPTIYLRDLILAIDNKCQRMKCILPELLSYWDVIPSNYHLVILLSLFVALDDLFWYSV
jgi:hypothetical protein